MNKLFNKIAALSVGLAMAIGVGVAVGSQRSDVRSVKATNYTYSGKTGTYDLWSYTTEANGGTAPTDTRLYAKNLITLTSSTRNFESVVFNLDINANKNGKFPNSATTNSGTVSGYPSSAGTNKSFTVTPDANCKTFTVTVGGTAGNWEISSFDVTLSGGASVTLDAVSGVSATVTAVQGASEWTVSDVAVTGTLTNVPNSDVTNYVDYSITTAVPNTVESNYTVTFAITKKTGVSGSFTTGNYNISNATVTADPFIDYTKISATSSFSTGKVYALSNAKPLFMNDTITSKTFGLTNSESSVGFVGFEEVENGYNMRLASKSNDAWALDGEYINQSRGDMSFSASGTSVWTIAEDTGNGVYLIADSARFLAINDAGTKVKTYANSNFGSYAALYLWEVGTLPAQTDPEISLSSSEVSLALSSSTSVTVTYTRLKAAMSVSSSNSSVASAAFDTYDYSVDGSVSLTISSGSTEGSATITISSTDATSQTISVTVEDVQEYTRITKTGKIYDGGQFLISYSGSNVVMGSHVTANKPYRSKTTASGSSPYSTLTLTGSEEAAIITITSGTGDYSDYYLLYDPTYNDNAGGYLEYYSSGLSTYKPNGTPSTDVYYWSINFDANGDAMIANKSNPSMLIQYNKNSGSERFMVYSGTQQKVSLLELSSQIPVDTPLSSITAPDASVEVGSYITYTGTYLPTNATELIEITLSDTYATYGEVIMANGTFTVVITGVSVTSGTSLSFVGEDGHGSISATLTVTAYAATHTKVTSSSGLYNGMKVILGNSDLGLVGAQHAGGNNVPAKVGSFGSDGSTLSNASGNAYEYTMWYLTIADSDENDVSGWAFYGNGNYLTCANNDTTWKQTQQLSSKCLFEITFTDGTASIVCADSHVQKGTIALNGSVISAYTSLGSYGPVDLYAKEASSDAAIAAGYEDFFLMMDVDLQSHGYCTSKGWYDHAKDVYNNTLTTDQKDELTAAAVLRLQAWAAANGDSLASNPGTIVANTRISIFSKIDITKDNGAALIIVIVSVLSVTAIGGYFFLRKKKEK